MTMSLNPRQAPIADLNPRTLHEVLSARSAVMGERRAYTFLGNSGDIALSFRELDERARAIAASLQETVQPGDRVMLLFPAGLDFICSFFGCLYAGARAVPTMYPKPRRPMPRLTTIAGDCGAVAVLTDSATLSTVDPQSMDLEGLRWIAVDAQPTAVSERATKFRPVKVTADEIAFLQYTSGSTSEPKGVMVSHGNLLHNLEMIRLGFGLHPVSTDLPVQTGVFWLPAYHDMGLIGGILESLYVGGHSVLMSPAAFLQRPLGWLETMSEYRATISGAPNFAYELCATRFSEEQRSRLDLSHWKVAFCGAEPIRIETLERFANTFASVGFRGDAFYPCYGLAEGTLLAAGGVGPARVKTRIVSRNALEKHAISAPEAHDDSDHQRLVACGGPLLGQEIVIANPHTRTRCGPNVVGEIWLHGKSIAQGYWNRAEESKNTFGAVLAGTSEGPFLRTGDLGFMADNQLYVTGRLKEVMIIRGRNHYPQDVEQTVCDAHEALRQDSGAVFTIHREGHEQLVVVHEIDRQYRQGNFDEILRAIRRAVADAHELEVCAVALIRHASLPRTTSGKAQRHLCRSQFLNDELKVLATWTREPVKGIQPPPAVPTSHQRSENSTGSTTARLTRSNQPMTPDELQRLGDRVECWLLDWLVSRAAIPQSEVHRDKPFAEYGLDSLTAVEMSQELEDWLGVEVSPTVAWNYPTPATLSIYLANQVNGGEPEALPEPSPQLGQDDFDRLLLEIESLSDADAYRMLDSEPSSGHR
jgi:acyl-CoA synthetase (AMP-forming)/AMP-acid ligase II/acyl carrier protein